MSGFLAWANYSKNHDPLLEDDDLFVLNANLVYTTLAGAVYTVKKGFLSDLGSIPPCCWWLLPRDSYPSAYFLHDYLCEADWISRKDADLILLEALLASNAPKWKAKAIYFFVRVYAYWNKIV